MRCPECNNEDYYFGVLGHNCNSIGCKNNPKPATNISSSAHQFVQIHDEWYLLDEDLGDKIKVKGYLGTFTKEKFLFNEIPIPGTKILVGASVAFNTKKILKGSYYVYPDMDNLITV